MTDLDQKTARFRYFYIKNCDIHFLNRKLRKMNVLMIGAGNMGLTYAEGMAKSPLLHKKK